MSKQVLKIDGKAVDPEGLDWRYTERRHDTDEMIVLDQPTTVASYNRAIFGLPGDILVRTSEGLTVMSTHTFAAFYEAPGDMGYCETCGRLRDDGQLEDVGVYMCPFCINDAREDGQ